MDKDEIICVFDINGFSWDDLDKENEPLEFFVCTKKSLVINYNDGSIVVYPRRHIIPITAYTYISLKNYCLMIEDRGITKIEFPLVILQDIKIIPIKKTRILQRHCIPNYINDIVHDALDQKGINKQVINLDTWFDEYIKIHLDKKKMDLQKGTS